MEEEIRKAIGKDARTQKYKQEEIDIAVAQIVEFLNKLKQMKVIETNQERPLNQLEQFIAINEFVTNRVYEDINTSHDIVGACVTGKAVCEGFCKLTQLLCEQVGIKTLYKHSVPKEKNGQIVSPGHGNMEIFVKDKKGNLHCLHNDSTIDSLKDKDIMTYNTTLIPDENINQYKYVQEWDPRTNAVWIDVSEGVTLKEQDEQLTPSFMDEILGIDRLERIRPHLIEMAICMGLDGEIDLSTKEQCLELYGKIYNKYQKVKLPIDNEEYLEALINVQKATLAYETNLSLQEIEEKSKQIIRDRIQASVTMQQRDWDGECGKSFIVDIQKGEFNYDEELEKDGISQASDTQLAEQRKISLLKSRKINTPEMLEADKNYKIDLRDMERNNEGRNNYGE